MTIQNCMNGNPLNIWYVASLHQQNNEYEYDKDDKDKGASAPVSLHKNCSKFHPSYSAVLARIQIDYFVHHHCP